MFIVASPKILSSYSSPFFFNPNPNPNSIPNPRITKTILFARCESERGIEFETGDSFFRRESTTGRDLGVLAAKLYRRSNGRLRVLDALCGCGVRSVRYLVEAEADFVLANDGNDEYGELIRRNLEHAAAESSEDKRRWNVTHLEANRAMADCYVQKDFFDLIDVDSFGSESSFLRSAMNAVKLNGLLYVTSTDGFSSGGHRPHHSLAAYGAYVRPMPYSNEIGLRMLIGGAVREASVLGYRVTPLFSYYSYHGPVFRVMLRVSRGKLPVIRHYGFISYCHKCGNSEAYAWSELGRINCPCSNSKSLIVSGPLWTGPLHDDAYLAEMLNLAKELGWAGTDPESGLEKVLKQMLDECDPQLPFGFIKLDEVASRAKVNSPPLRTIMETIQKEGYAVSRSHISSNALKTNCPMTECVRIAKELEQCHSSKI